MPCPESTTGGSDPTTGNQSADAEVQPLSGNLPLTFRAGIATEQEFSEDLRLMAGFDERTVRELRAF